MTPDRPEQLERWTGGFGDRYTQRNAIERWKLPHGVRAFNRMLDGISLESVLEVGSNAGLNFHYLMEVVDENVVRYAVEPNPSACRLLEQRKEELKLAEVHNCDGYSLPFADCAIDLVFTAGVLIHVAPDDLPRMTDEIVRVAKDYVLCIEYFSHERVEVPYRGESGLMWKTDYGAHYLTRYPELTCLRYGFLWQRELPVFDNLNWWLMKKSRSRPTS